MDKIRVSYHCEGEGWWADSPDVPGWTATAPTLHELSEMVESGVRFALERDDVLLVPELDRISDEHLVVFDFAKRTTSLGSSRLPGTGAPLVTT